MYTHDELVEMGKRWLSKPWRNSTRGGHGACSVILTEITTASNETPDMIGWSGSKSTLIECKTSLSDFRADAKKFFRVCSEQGVGDFRYYLAPEGVIPLAELPDRWGLLEINGKGKIRCLRASDCFHANHRNEKLILLSVLRRVTIVPEKCVSLRVYTAQTKGRASLTMADEVVR